MTVSAFRSVLVRTLSFAKHCFAVHNHTRFRSETRFRINHAACTLVPPGFGRLLPGLPAGFTTSLLARLWLDGTFTRWITITNFINASLIPSSWICLARHAVVRTHVCGNLNLSPIDAAEVSNTPSFAYILGKHPQIALASFPLRRVLVSELSPRICQDRKR